MRELDPLVSAAPIEQAGPAHIATLKTFDPPLSALDGRRLDGAERRGKNLLFPVDGDDLVLRVHLMSAGRLRFLAASAKKPKAPMFRLRFEGGAELVLTEAGKKKRAGVWLVTPEALDEDSPTSGRMRSSSTLRRSPRSWTRAPPAPSAAPRPARDRRHRPRPRERDPAAGAALAVQGVDRAERGGGGAARRRDPRRPVACPRAREQGKDDKAVYRVHNRLGEPCPECGTPIARVDYEEHTVYYCPTCQTGGRVLKDRRLSRLLR